MRLRIPFQFSVLTLAPASLAAVLVSVLAVGCSGGSGGDSPAAKPFELKNPKPRKYSTVAVYGDSLAFGTGSKNPESTIAACLVRELDLKDVTTVASEGGATTDDGLDGFSTLADLRPRVVIISLGGNDVLLAKEGQSFPEEKTLSNLRTLYQKLTKEGVLVVHLGLNPPDASAGRLPKIADVARDEGVLFVPDILDGLWNNPKLMADAIHPNDAGYAKVCERVAAAMKTVY